MALALPLLVGACTSAQPLVVDLRTDFAPQRDFEVASVETFEPRSVRLWGTQETRFELGQDLVQGAQLAVFEGLPAGSWILRTHLEDSAGEMVISHLLPGPARERGPEPVEKESAAEVAAVSDTRGAPGSARIFQILASGAPREALAESTLRELAPSLGRVRISCPSPCAPTLDGRALTSQPFRELTIYLRPGAHTLAANLSR